MEFKSINDLEKWFYKNKGDTVKFHFDLSNCLHLIIEDYQHGSERLVEFQHEMEMLTKIADEVFRFLTECFEQDSWSLDFFNKEYSWSFRCYDGTYCYLSLQDTIDYDEYMYKTGNK